MAEDWDLSAVVRSCTSTAHTTTTSATITPVDGPNSSVKVEEEVEPPLACLASLTFEEDDGGLLSFPDPSEPKSHGSLQDSYKPFLPAATTNGNFRNLINPPSSSSLPGVSTAQDHLRRHHQQERPAVTSGIGQPPPLTSASPPLFFFGQPAKHQDAPLLQPPKHQMHQRPSPVVSRAALFHPPRSRKRKSQQKRTVTQVTAENLSSDPWAWRKYGQKPIKGSPYPRNYYRCSSSKGCSARKQVERSNLEPNMYIVTYTGEHTHPRPTHRNSLAGSTRNKVGSAQKSAAAATEATGGSCPSRLSATSPTPAPGEASSAQNAEFEDRSVDDETEEMARADEKVDGESDEDDLLIPNMAVDDDFFKGLLSGGDGGSLGQSPALGDNFSSWGAGSSAAAGAAAGGH